MFTNNNTKLNLSQNWIVVINQRFLKKTLLYSSCAPSPGGRQKNPTNIGNIKENKKRIMQPESSMDPKLN